MAARGDAMLEMLLVGQRAAASSSKRIGDGELVEIEKKAREDMQDNA